MRNPRGASHPSSLKASLFFLDSIPLCRNDHLPIGVVPKRDITERDAAENLVADVLHVEQQLAACVQVDMPQPVYDALVSFSFNVGTAAACRSTLVSYLKHRQWEQACNQLSRWVYVNGVKSKGLENRRQRERAYCLKGTQ